MFLDDPGGYEGAGYEAGEGEGIGEGQDLSG